MAANPISPKTDRGDSTNTHKPRLRKPVQIDGVLTMADFSRPNRECRIDPAIGSPVVCLFGAELEQKVHDNIGQSVRVRGVAQLQADAGQIEYVQMSALEPVPQSIEELAQAQGVTAFSKSKAVDWFASDDEIEAFVDSIYNARKNA